jgi:hypothetical protein
VDGLLYTAAKHRQARIGTKKKEKEKENEKCDGTKGKDGCVTFEIGDGDGDAAAAFVFAYVFTLDED